jgi:hypothetical protein
MSKVKCYSVRVESYSFHGNSVRLTAFDGSSTTVPYSMFFGTDYEVQKSDAVWVAAFILEKSAGFQYSTKKVKWFEYEKQSKKESAEISEPQEEKEPKIVTDVKGYFLEWREVTLYVGPYGKRRDTKRQHIVTYQGPSNQAPKGFVELPEDEFEMAKKKEGKMIEPYTTPDFAAMIIQEKVDEERKIEQAKQAQIDEGNRKIAAEKEEEEKKIKAAELTENIEKMKADGVSILSAWKQLGCFHPAPPEVVEAKNASGLNWKKFTETI